MSLCPPAFAVVLDDNDQTLREHDKQTSRMVPGLSKGTYQNGAEQEGNGRHKGEG